MVRKILHRKLKTKNHKPQRVNSCAPLTAPVLTIVLSVLRYADSDYLPLVSSNSSFSNVYLKCSKTPTPVRRSMVRVAQSLVCCVVFRISLFVLFSFGHCIVCPLSIYGLLITPFVSSDLSDMELLIRFYRPAIIYRHCRLMTSVETSAPSVFF